MGYMRDIVEGFDAWKCLMDSITNRLDIIYDNLNNIANNTVSLEVIKEVIEETAESLERLSRDIKNKNV